MRDFEGGAIAQHGSNSAKRSGKRAEEEEEEESGIEGTCER